jgi:hypothetical protein
MHGLGVNDPDGSRWSKSGREDNGGRRRRTRRKCAGIDGVRPCCNCCVSAALRPKAQALAVAQSGVFARHAQAEQARRDHRAGATRNGQTLLSRAENRARWRESAGESYGMGRFVGRQDVVVTGPTSVGPHTGAGGQYVRTRGRGGAAMPAGGETRHRYRCEPQRGAAVFHRSGIEGGAGMPR